MLDDSHPIDLGALDPDDDAGAESRFVDAVMGRVSASGTRYPPRVDVLWGVWSFARPLAIAASLLILAASAVTVRALRPRRVAPATVAESVGVPRELVASMTAEARP